MTQVHPTAVIDPAAQLAESVEIGPFTCIGPHVRIGRGCRIGPHAVLEGWLELGEENIIGAGAVLGADPQDLAFKRETESSVRIGDRNTIREYCTIHRGTAPGSSTEVGNDNFLMTGAHLGHNVRVGNHVIIANNCLLAGHVEVQDRAFLGGGSVFHQFMRIGRLAIVKGGCRFGKDIPPFLIATGENNVAGLNSIGLRRSGMSAGERAEVKRAFNLLYRSGLNTSQALEQAAQQQWSADAAELFEFIRGARKRGICDLQRRTRRESAEASDEDR